MKSTLCSVALAATLSATAAGASADPAAPAGTAAPAIGVPPPAGTPAGPYLAPDGSLRYPYRGSLEPTLSCKPLFVCDVTLEAGETILNLAIGDSARWVVAAAQSGPSGSTPHVFIKPTESDLQTNLVITTTKRVYYLRLLANAATVEPSRISYSYPDEEAAAQAARDASRTAIADVVVSDLPLIPPDQLDYNYKIAGAKEIQPAKVYNDGVHSYIQFTSLPTDLPVVYAVAPDGSDQIVNYRLKDTIFIVDGIPTGFDLVLNGGTGKHGRGERRVYIRHN